MTAVDVDLVLERADSACLCGENHVLLMLDHASSHIRSLQDGLSTRY